MQKYATATHECEHRNMADGQRSGQYMSAKLYNVEYLKCSLVASRDVMHASNVITVT